MKLLRLLLFPVVPFYYVVTWLRNKLYDTGVFNSQSYDDPVICVGNLSTGGTGKTPMVEYLINFLQESYRVATLSRGYKRKSKGFRLASDSSTYEDLGDEPFQYHLKYPKIQVAVSEERQVGIDHLLSQNAKPNVILLDDAFQHRKVKAGLNIVLSAFDQPYYKDIVLPTGNLREPRAGYKRADVIIITKCPKDLDPKQKIEITRDINPLSEQEVYFSWIEYAPFVTNNKESIKPNDLKRFTLVTGIANPSPLVNHLKKQGLNFDHMAFSDHHNFSKEELESLNKLGNIITTEKDYIRLQDSDILDLSKVFYLPIKMKIDREEQFNERVLHFLKP